MLLEIAAGCLAHGITSAVVHGLPAFRLAIRELEPLGYSGSFIKFTLIWIVIYTVMTPMVFYRLFQPSMLWIMAHKEALVQSQLENQ
jgi:hypothetical protein